MVRSARTLLAFSALALFAAGCGSKSDAPHAESSPGAPPTAESTDHGDHDHSGHDHSGHDHSGHDDSDHDHSDHGDHGHAAAAHSPQLPAGTPPQDVVHKFLESLRSGDETVASYLLTDKAREETAKHDLVVSPPGTPSAQYQVGAIELSDNQNGAYVTSIWTEPDQEGADQAYEIIWVMRKQPEGWRIAGMATEIIPGEMPLFLNFEDPQDMLRKREQALATLQQMHQAALATQPSQNTQQAQQIELPQQTQQR